MKRYKQIFLYVVSTMSSIYNCCDRWHVKWIIKKLIVSVQNFWYDPRRMEQYKSIYWDNIQKGSLEHLAIGYLISFQWLKYLQF